MGRPGQAPGPLPTVGCQAETARAGGRLRLLAALLCTSLCSRSTSHLSAQDSVHVTSTALQSGMLTSCVTLGKLLNLSEP